MDRYPHHLLLPYEQKCGVGGWLSIQISYAKPFHVQKCTKLTAGTDLGVVTWEGQSPASSPSHSMWMEERRWRLVACCDQVSEMVGKRSVDLR